MPSIIRQCGHQGWLLYEDLSIIDVSRHACFQDFTYKSIRWEQCCHPKTQGRPPLENQDGTLTVGYEIGYFSYDDKHEFHLDQRSLRYYYPPALPVDLSKGFDTFQQLDDTHDDHLDALLKTIVHIEQSSGAKCSADIVTWRGMMTKVLRTLKL